MIRLKTLYLNLIKRLTLLSPFYSFPNLCLSFLRSFAFSSVSLISILSWLFFLLLLVFFLILLKPLVWVWSRDLSRGNKCTCYFMHLRWKRLDHVSFLSQDGRHCCHAVVCHTGLGTGNAVCYFELNLRMSILVTWDIQLISFEERI